MFAFSIGTPQLITLILALLGGVTGLFWFMIKIIVKQFNEALNKRFETLERAREAENNKTADRFKKLEEAVHEAEKEMHRFKLEVSQNYWLRDDAIRNESVTQNKLDNIARMIFKLQRP